jgi:hypothetical protein
MTHRTGHPSFVLRIDAGPRIGYGHAGRCLALWEQLQDRCLVAVTDSTAATFVRRWGVRLAPPGASGDVTVLDRAPAAGVDEVLALGAADSAVCLIDDAGLARPLADAVVDPPTGADWPVVDGSTLGGFEHALVRREIREAAADPLPGVGVLVSLGGSDPLQLTAGLCTALDAAGAPTTAVLGPGYAGARPGGCVLPDPSLWPRALAGAELLVTRYGHTLLEAAHLGVPTIAVAQSAQDTRDAAAFAAHGTAAWAEVEDAVATVVELLGAPKRLAEMARRGPELVDGLGAERVARALVSLR